MCNSRLQISPAELSKMWN